MHIGDHPHSDHNSPRRHGFSILRYANVHTLGDPHRAHDLSVVTGSIYRGLVNAKLHGSDARFSMAFELGYVYGSLLAIGYCQYLQEQCRRLGLDQLLFLARDGDILRQVYALLYPQERADLIYVPWSRSAGIQLLAEAWKPDYFRRFLTHKCNQGLTLTQVFSAMGLEGLLPLLNQERSLDPGSELTAHEETQVRSFLLDHFDQILQCYERRRAGARHLLEPWLSSPGRVGVVDIGWTGSAAIALRALGEQWGWQKEIIGFLVGSDACWIICRAVVPAVPMRWASCTAMCFLPRRIAHCGSSMIRIRTQCAGRTAVCLARSIAEMLFTDGRGCDTAVLEAKGEAQ